MSTRTQIICVTHLENILPSKTKFAWISTGKSESYEDSKVNLKKTNTDNFNFNFNLESSLKC